MSVIVELASVQRMAGPIEASDVNRRHLTGAILLWPPAALVQVGSSVSNLQFPTGCLPGHTSRVSFYDEHSAALQLQQVGPILSPLVLVAAGATPGARNALRLDWTIRRCVLAAGRAELSDFPIRSSPHTLSQESKLLDTVQCRRFGTRTARREKAPGSSLLEISSRMRY